MNTDKEILIAEFMGLSLNPESIGTDFVQCQSPTREDKAFETIRFHSDWNWLMELVKAISELETKMDSSNLSTNETFKDFNRVLALPIYSNKKVVYAYCVDFIIRYNVNFPK
jgi:hypothetical protein